MALGVCEAVEKETRIEYRWHSGKKVQENGSEGREILSILGRESLISYGAACNPREDRREISGKWESENGKVEGWF